MVKEKRISSGKLFEFDIFHCWSDGRAMPTRAAKQKRSTAEQEKYNKNQAVKKAIHLINSNFDNNDIFMSPTYEPDKAPQNEEEARRDLVNYLRRVKTRRASELKKVIKALAELPDKKSLEKQRKQLEVQKSKLEAPFKYLYVIEKETYKRGPLKGRANWHFHLVFTGGIDRTELEEMWPNGLRCNAKRFQPEKFGPESLAKYMSKDPQGSKRFVCSRNLDRTSITKPKVKDSRLTPGKVARIAQDRVEDRAFWEKKFKGYRFIRCYSRYNEHNGQWYISVIMYRDDKELPEWKYDDWIVW